MTRAPAAASARAVARPMPRDAPVTSAVLLSRSVMVVLLCELRLVWNSRSGLAAIDVDDLTGNEGRLGRAGEHDDVGDFFGPAGAFQRNARQHACLPVGAAGEAVEQRGFDRPGRDGV